MSEDADSSPALLLANVSQTVLLLITPRFKIFELKKSVANFLFNFVFPFSSQKQLTRLHITCEGTIEENGYGMLQVNIHFEAMQQKTSYQQISQIIEV